MLLDDKTRNSAEYREFWDGLNRGENQSGEFKRVAKGGKEVLAAGFLQSYLGLEWQTV